MTRRFWKAPFWMLVQVSGLLTLLAWWWLRQRPEGRVAPWPRETEPPVRPERIPVPLTEAAPAPPDDLRRIAGIGPKISSVLNAAGITTYVQLAEMDAKRLRKALMMAVRLLAPSYS